MRQTELQIPKFTGPLAKQCENFIKSKRAVGYKYKSEAVELQIFDKISSLCEKTSGLSKEMVEAFISQKGRQSPKSKCNRIYVMREFARFLAEIGIPAFVPKHSKLISSFVPYIFTEEQISNMFYCLDKAKPKKSSGLAHLVYPVLFRALYGCGLRVSEAVNLKLGDIDLKNKTLTIRNSKFGKDRLIVMSNTLTNACAAYAEKIHVFSDDLNWFFPSNDKRGYSTGAIYSRFRMLLIECGISHGGRGKGPRLHDFRHTFAVYCLNNWVRNNNDPFVLLPVLSAYLGHSAVSATEKYLRLIPQMNCDIIKKTDERFPNIIPWVKPELWEECDDE